MIAIIIIIIKKKKLIPLNLVLLENNYQYKNKQLKPITNTMNMKQIFHLIQQYLIEFQIKLKLTAYYTN